jgi:hypothetical protein
MNKGVCMEWIGVVVVAVQLNQKRVYVKMTLN